VRLTVQTDYALRLLMYLALNEPDSATIGQAASSLQVSKNHLMKIVHRLGLGGFIRTLRGKSGGLRLARPSADIRLGDVVRYTESDMALVPCFAPVGAACIFLPQCALRQALDGALAAFLQVLDRHSVADLTSNRAGLRALLAMEAPAADAIGRKPAGPRPGALKPRQAAARNRTKCRCAT
jgi:Rrf2 family nitric oxide-sensitive transcriptional repressor